MTKWIAVLPLVACVEPATSTADWDVLTLGATANGHFAEAMVVGDFDGDGFDDLAVSEPGGNPFIGPQGSGAVFIYRGTSHGLVLTQEIDEVFLNQTATGDQFGAALAAADFDGDGLTDLVIGSPNSRRPGGTAAAGVVFVLFGGPNGPMTSRIRILDQADSTAHQLSESGDRFGAALATGALGGGNAPDLVVGVPGENGGRGYVNTFTFDRPTGAFVEFHGIASPFTDPTLQNHFGATVAIGDFNLDGRGDVVIGTGYDILTNRGAGAVNIAPGTSSGFGPLVSVPGPADAAYFGAALGVGAFDGAKYEVAPIAGQLKQELVVGATWNWDGSLYAGRVFLYRPQVAADRTFTMRLVQTLADPPSESGSDTNLFGAAIAVGKLSSANQTLDDIVVGEPAGTAGLGEFMRPGELVTFHGATGGMVEGATLGWAFGIDGAGVLVTPRFGDSLGGSVAIGHFATGKPGLVGGMPNRVFAEGPDPEYDTWLNGAGAVVTFVNLGTDAFAQTGYFDASTN